jgi:hypothetical protein
MQSVTSPCRWIIYESVKCASVRSCFSTVFLIWTLCPKIFSALWTMLPYVAFFPEEWKTVFFSWKPFQLLGTPEMEQLGVSKD